MNTLILGPPQKEVLIRNCIGQPGECKIKEQESVNIIP